MDFQVAVAQAALDVMAENKDPEKIAMCGGVGPEEPRQRQDEYQRNAPPHP